MHRRILTINYMYVFLCCVKRNLHNSRLIKLFTPARLSQSHTNNGFFKLVEALLHICWYFISHSMKLYAVYRYQQCHRLAAIPANISVFNSHMQAPTQLFQINLDYTMKQTGICTIKTGCHHRGVNGALPPHPV